MLVMTRYPEFQKTAKNEIYDVIGRGRLPHIGDKASLPYIRSVITEIVRWAPPLPLGK
jgi:cytochrome P450